MRILASAALVVSAISAPAGAAVVRDYNYSLFIGLQMRNEPIVLFVTDGACHECETANASVKKIATTRGYESVHVLRIDTSKQKGAARGHNVHSYPTLIGFHGFTERGRLANETDLSKVSTVFASTLR